MVLTLYVRPLKLLLLNDGSIGGCLLLLLVQVIQCGLKLQENKVFYF